MGLEGLLLYFLIFSRLQSSARFCALGNQPDLNDADDNFCQACGVPTAPLVSAVPHGRGPVDEKVIQERFQEFKSLFERWPYQHQKSALSSNYLRFSCQFPA